MSQFESASNSPFAQILKDINSLMFERPIDVTIKVNSIDDFTNELSESVDLKTANANGLTRLTFGGAKVNEIKCMPEGLAVIMHGVDIVTMVRYRK